MDRPVHQPVWRKALVIGGPTLAVVVFVAVCLFEAFHARATLSVSRASVSVGKVEAGVFQDFSPIRATVVARDVVSIDAGEGGQVKEVLAQSGDLVVAGQPLVRFDNPDLAAQVLERQSRQMAAIRALQSELNGLEDARASSALNLAEMNFDLSRLQANYEKQQAIFDKGFGRPIDRDEAKLSLDRKLAARALRTEIDARAEAMRQQRQPEIVAEIKEARQTLATIRDSLGGLVVKAPGDGRLTEFSMNVGQRKGRSELIGKLTLNTGFKLTAPIDPYYLGRVRVGQAAQVTVTLLDGFRTLNARVSRVDPQVKDGVFQIELEFVGKPSVDLLEGQALDGRVLLGDDTKALVAPAGPWLDAAGGNWVMVLEPQGRFAERRPVKTGKRSEAQVEVLSGLKAGESIVTSSYETFDKIQKLEFSK